MHSIPDTALTGRSDDAGRTLATLAVAALATAGAIVLSLVAPAGSNSALSGGPSAAVPALRDVSFVEGRCPA